MLEGFKICRKQAKVDERGRVTLTSALANQYFAVLANEQGQYLLDPIVDNPRHGWLEGFERMRAEEEDTLEFDSKNQQSCERLP